MGRWPRLARWHGADRGAYMTGTVFQSLSKVILNDRRDDNIITRYNSESGVGSLYFLDERRNNRASVLFGRNMLSTQTLYTIDLNDITTEDPLRKGIDANNIFYVTGIGISKTVSLAIGKHLRRNSPEVRVMFEVIWVDDYTFLVVTRLPHTWGSLIPRNDVEREEIRQQLDADGTLIRMALLSNFPTHSIVTLKDYLSSARQTSKALPLENATTYGDSETLESSGLLLSLSRVFSGVFHLFGSRKRSPGNDASDKNALPWYGVERDSRKKQRIR